MGYIKLKNYNEHLELREPVEESMNGMGYWYLRLVLNANLTAEEINNIFIPENLIEITVVDDLEQETVLFNYIIVVSIRKTYDPEDNTKNWLNITLQKVINGVDN